MIVLVSYKVAPFNNAYAVINRHTSAETLVKSNP